MNIFITRLKVILRRKDNIFWALIFPLCLGIIFYLGFGNLTEGSFLKQTDVYIASENIDSVLITQMETIEINDDEKLFIVNTEFTANELENKLTSDEIDGYIYYNGEKIIYRINESGITQTIIKSFLDQYLQIESLVAEVIASDPSKLDDVLTDLQTQQTYLKLDLKAPNPNANSLIIYFYVLIAMACLFASYWGISLVNDVQANMSDLGIRVNIAPTHKFKLIFIYFLAALLIHYIGNILLIIFLKYILGIEFTDNIFLILLVSLIGTISGIALGAFLSTIIKGSLNLKEGMTTVITLVLSALSGLMFLDLKYYVEKSLPIMKYINPASLLTDAFNSLYYYSDYSMFYQNIINLLIISLIFIIITYIVLRGKKYDSI